MKINNAMQEKFICFRGNIVRDIVIINNGKNNYTTTRTTTITITTTTTTTTTTNNNNNNNNMFIFNIMSLYQRCLTIRFIFIPLTVSQRQYILLLIIIIVVVVLHIIIVNMLELYHLPELLIIYVIGNINIVKYIIITESL